jgi:hypothetical protein
MRALRASFKKTLTFVAGLAGIAMAIQTVLRMGKR